MATYPDHLDPTERRIIGMVIARALANKCAIRVWDGEEYATPITQKADTIKPEVAATDCTVFEIWEPTGEGKKCKRLGNIIFIHGNGEDVLSDFSAHDNELLDRMEKMFAGIAA